MLFAGYDFKDESLLTEALTTPSYRMDHPAARDNQRLEFLGDAVIGVLAAELVFRKFPKESEGELTIRRSHLVSTAALSAAAQRLELTACLRFNRAASLQSVASKTLADAVEALIGAAYLDGGWSAARQVMSTLELEAHAENSRFSVNPKGMLQEKMQALKPQRHPQYTLVSVAGQSHQPVFTVRVEVEGIGGAEATAGSRHEAEALAAAKLLDELPSLHYDTIPQKG